MEKNNFGIVLRLLLFVQVVFSFSDLKGQNNLSGTYWQNGSTFMFFTSESDTAVTSFTGTLHEGSASAPWIKTNNPKIFLRPNQVGNAWTDTIIHYYDSIVHNTICGQDALLVYGRDRHLTDIMLRYDGLSSNKWYEMSHGFDTLLENTIRRQITGLYHVSGKQQAWRITYDSISIFSLSSLPNQPVQGYSYSIRWGEVDNPEHVLMLSDGSVLCFQATAEGIDLYKGIVHLEDHDMEWVSQGDLYLRLTKTGLDNSVPGRWPEASTRLLTRGWLDFYPPEVLRLIRNEIYARHGHRFSDPRLTDFYNKEGLWYGTALLKGETPLTELEQLNIQLIQAIEKEHRQK